MRRTPLQQTWKDSIQTLIHTVFPHAHYSDALEEVRANTTTYSTGDILLLTGPTGAGKSTLITEYLRGEAQIGPDDPVELIPKRCPWIVYTEVRSPHEKPFKYRFLYVDAMRYCGDITADSKAIPVSLTRQVKRLCALSKTSGLNHPVDSYRFHTERLYSEIGVEIWIIDEAQEMLRVGSVDMGDLNLNVVKSASNRNGYLPFLVGTYEFALAFNLSAQWNRRLSIVHLARYNIDIDAQAQEFANILASFDAKFGNHFNFRLSEKAQFVYDGSAGSIGEVTQWMKRSMRRASAGGRSAVTVTDFERAAHTILQVASLNREVTEGEKKLEEFRESHPESFVSAPPPKRPKPGRRKPHRDTVGAPR